ncbi:helix-turn-helix transcriptional regulator [Saccharothrix xinjiangensis]|uniref:Helix-turn-helix domain-containing protein n=1 Tax=Saccharothrix xinjiangensis TaxID=204798 RepID=A0ABV9XZ26_9PSEU
MNREELAGELRRLRIEARMTGTVTARVVGMSQSKLPKIENGMLLPSVTDVERLTAELSATRELRSRLVELARQLYTEAKTRRVVLHRGAQRHQQTVARIEARATAGRFFQNAGVPALLQSENYLRVVLNTLPPHEQDAARATLHARRARMDDLGKRYFFLLTESALRWRMGPASLMCEQSDHILSVATKPNVQVGVVPWTADANMIAVHGFQVYDERVVTLNVLTGNATITDLHDVREYLALFGRLERLAVHDDVLERISEDHRKLG